MDARQPARTPESLYEPSDGLWDAPTPPQQPDPPERAYGRLAADPLDRSPPEGDYRDLVAAWVCWTDAEFLHTWVASVLKVADNPELALALAYARDRTEMIGRKIGDRTRNRPQGADPEAKNAGRFRRLRKEVDRVMRNRDAITFRALAERIGVKGRNDLGRLRKIMRWHPTYEIERASRGGREQLVVVRIDRDHDGDD